MTWTDEELRGLVRAAADQVEVPQRALRRREGHARRFTLLAGAAGFVLVVLALAPILATVAARRDVDPGRSSALTTAPPQASDAPAAACTTRLPPGADHMASADLNGDGHHECIFGIDQNNGRRVVVAAGTAQHDIGLSAMRMSRPSVRLYLPPESAAVLVVVGGVGADAGEVRVLRWRTDAPELLLVAGGKTIDLSGDAHSWPTVTVGVKEGPATLRTVRYVWDGGAYRAQ